MIKTLPGEQVEVLEKAYKASRKKREAMRYQALLLQVKGYSREETAEIIGITTHAIDRWRILYRRNGCNGLKEKGQPGNHRKLTKEQKEELKQLIIANTPEQLDFEGKFWNPVLVSKLIKLKYNITYLPEASRRLLHRFNFTFHKPEKVNKRQKTGDRLRFEEKLKKDSETGVTEVIRWYW